MIWIIICTFSQSSSIFRVLVTSFLFFCSNQTKHCLSFKIFPPNILLQIWVYLNNIVCNFCSVMLHVLQVIIIMKENTIIKLYNKSYFICSCRSPWYSIQGQLFGIAWVVVITIIITFTVHSPVRRFYPWRWFQQ